MASGIEHRIVQVGFMQQSYRISLLQTSIVRVNDFTRANANPSLVLVASLHPEGSCINDGRQSKSEELRSSIACIVEYLLHRVLGG